MPLFSFSWSKPVASDSTLLSDSGEREREREREREKKREEEKKGEKGGGMLVVHRNF